MAPTPPRPEGEPLAGIVLIPGDLLYLPRGWWHTITADQGHQRTDRLRTTRASRPHCRGDKPLKPVEGGPGSD
ncbi:JmjC domain-containing protein [Streptomyces virginiae]|uniref:JmjC domain-containing protein n=1 Tax=Streptomyces virginiae TaxID=1961 RepID=UPI003691FD13